MSGTHDGTWSHEPITSMHYEVKTTPRADGVIEQEVSRVMCSKFESVRETLWRHVLDTREQQVKAALVALGWTPPPTTDHHPV